MHHPVPSTSSPSLSLLSHALSKTTQHVTTHNVLLLPSGHKHIPLTLFLPIHAQDAQAPPRLSPSYTSVWCCTSDSLPHCHPNQWFSFFFFSFGHCWCCCCLWFIILQSFFSAEAECCPASCCLPWFPSIYWDRIALLINSFLHPFPSSPCIVRVRPF